LQEATDPEGIEGFGHDKEKSAS